MKHVSEKMIKVAKIARTDIPTEEIIDKISGLWQPLNEEQRELLLDSLMVEHYKKNALIYCENEEPVYLMCVINGKVKIFKDGVGGRRQIIRVIKPYEYFAYRAYFAHGNYVTAAAAFESTDICMIPMELIEKFVNQNNALAAFFIHQLSVDLGVADERTVSLTQKHIRARLAEALLFLKDSYGLEEDESTLSIYLSREDLASLSNMTTANAIRTLSLFSGEKLIAIDGRKIKLIDVDKLKRISKIG